MLKDNFRKGMVIKRAENRKFEIKDLYDGSIKIARLYGKSMLEYNQIQLGISVYIIKDYPLISEDWRILTKTHFKGDDFLWNLKIELDTLLFEKNSSKK